MPPNAPVDLTKAVNLGSLKDRNVLVTGGSSGLGKSFVHMFAENGANVVFGDMQDSLGKDVEQEVQAKAKGGKIKYFHVDVTSFDSQVTFIREALDFFPRNEVDIFVPNAGILHPPTTVSPQDPAGLADLKGAPPPEFAGSVIKVNLTGVYTGVLLVARYAMGLHKAAEGGPTPPKAIVLIASLAGYCGAEGSVEYTTSKYGVRGLMRGLRKQLAGLGVRLNAVAPFYVETPMTAQAVPVLKSFGIPIAPIEFVTEAVARLATDDQAYGRTIFVMPEGLSDGGDDAAGGEGGKSFSKQAFGEHWAVLVDGPMSDNIPA